MIFSDPSGDDGIHPVSPLQLPIINPPPTRSAIVHRTATTVVTYKKYVKHTRDSRLLIAPMNIDHLYYKVKDLLDDGTGSSIDRLDLTETEKAITRKPKSQTKSPSKKTTSKYLDDGSFCLKQEISQSENRVRSVRAGKNLQFLFPDPTKKFIQPNKSLYTRQRLGTPLEDINSKEIRFYSRKRQVSLMNSSPHRPFIMLPSLKEILLQNEQQKDGIFQPGNDLSQKFEKLDKSFGKKNRIATMNSGVLPEKKLVNIVKNHLKAGTINETLIEDPVIHVLDRFKEFDDGKEKMKSDLKDLLATQKYDRPESIWLKYKHFKPTSSMSIYQGRMVDIWNMRMEAEKERLENNRGMMKQICWYRDILWFTIEKCQDINPLTYYILDYIKALTEECINVTKITMENVFADIPLSERSKGNNLLIHKILHELSSPLSKDN